MKSHSLMPPKKWAVANWKQFGRREMARAWCGQLSAAASSCQVVVCPPLPYVSYLRGQLPLSVAVGAQDVSAAADDGAHTGEVGAAMLADVGCGYAIVGHSERRAMGEDDAACAAKLGAAAGAGLIPILCVGESLETRKSGAEAAVEFVTQQLDAALAGLPESTEYNNTNPPRLPLLVAYEPVWAIGSGEAAKVDDIVAMHAALYAQLYEKFDRIALLYGGSVSPSNIGELSQVDCVDGVLVGGASLEAGKFNQIVTALSS